MHDVPPGPCQLLACPAQPGCLVMIHGVALFHPRPCTPKQALNATRRSQGLLCPLVPAASIRANTRTDCRRRPCVSCYNDSRVSPPPTHSVNNGQLYS